jgi:hypothetical protein
MIRHLDRLERSSALESLLTACAGLIGAAVFTVTLIVVFDHLEGREPEIVRAVSAAVAELKR